MANPFKEADKMKKKAPGANPGDKKEGQEHTQEVSGTESEPAVQEETRNEQAANAGQGSPTDDAAVKKETKDGLASIYENERKFDIEARTVRLQLVTTPSIAKKLDWLDKTGKIKSRNDLINFLLERYMATVPDLDENK